MNCFNFGSLKLFISLLFALPVENIETMSFVLVSPSHVIALKVVLIFRLSICFKIDEEILASVKINPKVVAIFGKIIPDPFATPYIFTLEPAILHSAIDNFGLVSVVIIPRAALIQINLF